MPGYGKHQSASPAVWKHDVRDNQVKAVTALERLPCFLQCVHTENGVTFTQQDVDGERLHPFIIFYDQ
jgi:hypothetical protein